MVSAWVFKQLETKLYLSYATMGGGCENNWPLEGGIKIIGNTSVGGGKGKHD